MTRESLTNCSRSIFGVEKAISSDLFPKEVEGGLLVLQRVEVVRRRAGLAVVGLWCVCVCLFVEGVQGNKTLQVSSARMSAIARIESAGITRTHTQPTKTLTIVCGETYSP